LRYRKLGRTDLAVSAISLGTVSLGLDYGISAPGQSGRPDELSAVRLLRYAAERGINFLDTAPAYGDSERFIGRALGSNPRIVVATKLHPPPEGMSQRDGVDRSIEISRRALGRDTLDIVQMYNATAESIAAGGITDALLEARHRGAIRFIGASLYGEENALAAIESGHFDMLQIPFNVLDQRMAAKVLPAADAAGVGVIVRSALLKGALTEKAQWLPGPLERLLTAAERARDLLADGSWDGLAKAALRFCLSFPAVSSVLTGAKNIAEVDAALEAEAEGALSDRLLADAAQLALDEERLVNPFYWPMP
jgi:aryl-alcohol dehydrogenase-like predicted oxidoreductase